MSRIGSGIRSSSGEWGFHLRNEESHMAKPKFTLRQLFTLMTWVAVALGLLAAQYYWHAENKRLRTHIWRLGQSLERTSPAVKRSYQIFGDLTESDVSQIEAVLRDFAEHGDSQASNPIVLMQWKLMGVGRDNAYYEVEVLTEGRTRAGNQGTRYVFEPRQGRWQCGRTGGWNESQLDHQELHAIREFRDK